MICNKLSVTKNLYIKVKSFFKCDICSGQLSFHNKAFDTDKMQVSINCIHCRNKTVFEMFWDK